MNENKSYDNNTDNLSKAKTDKWVKHKKKFKPIGRERDIFMSIRINQSESDKLAKDISRTKLTKSEYIRNLIVGYKIKIPEVKEEPKPKKEEYIIENIAKALEENIECLIKVKNKFHYLGYFEDERAIGTKIEYLKLQNTTLKKYIPIENDKDNAI